MTGSQNSLLNFTVVLLILVLALTGVTPAFAEEGHCLSNGGTWSGSDDDNGRCTYPAGGSIATAACTTSGYTVTYVNDMEVKSGCGNGQTAKSTHGPSEETFTLRLGGDRNGWVTFSANVCQKNCTIDSILPGIAEASILTTPVASMYVRIDGGNPVGFYTVCFANPNYSSHTVYRFVGGIWTPVARSTGATICAAASGEGAFFLGGKP